ncbi:MAG TPA: ELM1/GtrOC1 family putative glycosyltransferase [Hansschlegelia sp.]
MNAGCASRARRTGPVAAVPIPLTRGAMSDGPRASDPLIWLLTDDRPGNRTQAVGAARTVGWPTVEKRLAFNDRQTVATPRLGATLETLDTASRASIVPPYPDLVIAAGRRAVPVAAWLRREAGARVVLIGRRTPDGVADLTVRTAYLRQVPHPRLLELALPLTQIDAERLAEARIAEPDPLEGLARPRVAFLVGGPTGQHDMSDAFAAGMAREVAAAAADAGGGLAILTSRRTPASAVSAIRGAAPGARLIAWSPDATYNPYVATLANADLLVVTGESESMLAEAVAAGLPLTIYPLVARPLSAKARVRAGIASLALGHGPLAALCGRVMSEGWVAPRRDLVVMHRLIEERGWGRVFDGRLNRESPLPHDERRALGDRIRAVMAEGKATA